VWILTILHMKQIIYQPGGNMFFNKLSRAFFVYLLSILLISMLCSGVFGQSRKQPNLSKLDRLLKKYDLVRINLNKAINDIRQTHRLNINASNKTFNIVNLTPHNLLNSERYLAEETVGHGLRIPVSRIPVNTFRGKLAGEAGSEVRLTAGNDKIEGTIITSSREVYHFEPAENFNSGISSSDIVVYNAEDVNLDALGECGLTLAGRLDEVSDFLNLPATSEAVTTREVELATEADYEYVQAAGGSAQANSLITSIINQIEGIYINELGLSFKIVYQHTWATNDDPYTSTNPSTILSEFRSHWNSNFTGIARDLTHMWTGKDMDGSVIGIATVGVVCRAPSSSYGVSQRLTGQVARVGVTAHEIGHNFSAGHVTTSECNNTLMYPSLSSNLQLTFCEASRNQITNHVNTYPSCLRVVSTDPTPTPTPTPVPTPTPAPTNLIVNPGFEANGEISDSIIGWNTWSSFGYLDADGTWTPEAHGGTFFAYHWRNTNYDCFTYQEKTGLSNGLYTLRAWVRSSGGQSEAQMGAAVNGGNTWVYVNIPSTWTWTRITLSNIRVSDGTCVVGFWSVAGPYQEIDFDDVEFFKQ
jgi:hypothetical protein